MDEHNSRHVTYRKIPKICPRANIFHRLILRGLFVEERIFGPGGLYSEGRFNGGTFPLRVWEAYKSCEDHTLFIPFDPRISYVNIVYIENV